MTSSISSTSGRSPITLAAGFLGAFIVGSLAVQLVRSQTASVQAGTAGSGTSDCRASCSLGSLGRSATSSQLHEHECRNRSQAAAASKPAVEPVVGSEATLWAPFGER